MFRRNFDYLNFTSNLLGVYDGSVLTAIIQSLEANSYYNIKKRGPQVTEVTTSFRGEIGPQRLSEIIGIIGNNRKMSWYEHPIIEFDMGMVVNDTYSRIKSLTSVDAAVNYLISIHEIMLGRDIALDWEIQTAMFDDVFTYVSKASKAEAQEAIKEGKYLTNLEFVFLVSCNYETANLLLERDLFESTPFDNIYSMQDFVDIDYININQPPPPGFDANSFFIERMNDYQKRQSEPSNQDLQQLEVERIRGKGFSTNKLTNLLTQYSALPNLNRNILSTSYKIHYDFKKFNNYLKLKLFNNK